MSFADDLRNTKQQSYTFNGRILTDEKEIKRAHQAESIAEEFRRGAKERASFGKNRYVNTFLLDGWSLFDRIAIAKMVNELLKNDGYNFLSVFPCHKTGVDIYVGHSTDYYIKIIATW